MTKEQVRIKVVYVELVVVRQVVALTTVKTHMATQSAMRGGRCYSAQLFSAE